MDPSGVKALELRVVWVDPVIDRALVCLTDREFDAWALEAWPVFSDAVIDSQAHG